jgi:anaerobic magnesium-protoporphyrin IX monomethyl ester cyclase
MAHLILLGITEPKSADNKVWKLPYALPIIVRQLQKTSHTFEVLDTHLHKLTFTEIAARALAKKRQVYGISAWSHNYLQVKELASRIRAAYPEAVIIVGGILSGNDEAVLNTTDVDIVSTGAEGEHILPELLDCIDRGLTDLGQVDGISYRGPGGEVIRTQKRRLMTREDFQKQEFPAYDYFDEQMHEIAANLKTRHDVPIQAFPLLTMRGCPFRCTFCGHMYGHRILRKNWDLFFDEVLFLVDRYGYTGFFSNDTNMFLNEKDAHDYCAEYKRRGATFHIVAELRLTFGDEALFRKLSDHGIKIVNYGLESGSQDILDRMQKGTRMDTCRRIIKETLDADVMIHGNFIFGIPGENKHTIKETREFMFEIERMYAAQRKRFAQKGRMNTSGYGWTVLLLSPTSALYREAIEEGLITDEAAYLASLSDERFMQLAKGSTFKISLAQEAGEINMSEFSSRTALAHYVKFSMHWVAFLARFLETGRWVGQPQATLKFGWLAVKHYGQYLKTAFGDALDGRKGYVPRDKRAGAKPLKELSCCGK